MWIPAQTTRPPLRTAFSARGTKAPTGAKMMAASSGSGGACPESPAHAAPRAKAKSLRGRIARPSEGEHRAALPSGHLRQYVRGRAEAVEPQPIRIAGDGEGSPADHSGAQQRRQRLVAAALTQRERESRIRNGCGRVAAVARVAGEQRPVAQVLPLHQTIGADAAGVAEPRNADALTELEPLDAPPERIDAADDLMPRDDGQTRLGQFAVDHVQVGAAHPAGAHLDPNLARAGLPILKLGPFERSLRAC